MSLDYDDIEIEQPRAWPHCLLIVAVFALALAPVLTWVEFSGGMENFNVATAQESQRDNQWIIPYLGLAPRAAKPPLLHWITAAGIRLIPQSLALGARIPSIPAACGLLLAVYALGRSLEDWKFGLTGAFICGTTLLFLKFAWQASYDLHLALWVMVANACFAGAMYRDHRWIGCLGAGAAIGCALMVKGPVALLQTIVPWAAFLIFRSRKWKQQVFDFWPYWDGPINAGFVVLLLIAAPWTAYALYKGQGIMGMWANEVTLGTESAYETRARWHSYIVFFPMMLPWLIWFLTGFVEIVREGINAAAKWSLLFWLVLPIAVMIFFPERRDRYLLPMLGPAALIAAHGVLRHVPEWRKWTKTQKQLVILHGAIVAVIAIGLPLAGATGVLSLVTVDGKPWYTPAFAAAVCFAALVIYIAAIFTYRLHRIGLTAGTVALMLMTNIVFLWGYKDSASGRSQGKVFAEQILQNYPDAVVFNAAPQRRQLLPLELLIYLDRDVRSLSEPDKLRHDDPRPQILIYPPADESANPNNDPPAGFTPLAKLRINTGVYEAFVRGSDQ